ncbi:Stress induced hydrophobic peptide [Pseudomonas savastanoi]|uniref:Stress induced hydrophobic peptide n=1 Tax=Pseudomonas savastanoi TaxID=29438 RepID=A0A3M5HA39_PSESS|nr:Stress induced hydrophobic peptide [Pseudomonas savastanoi]
MANQSQFNQELLMDIIRIIFAILLPPVGVFMQVGFAGAFWLNILLTLLGYIPGIIHAIYIIVSRK